MPDVLEIAGYLGAGGLGAAALKLIDTLVSKRRTPEQRLADSAGAASELIELALRASGSSVEQLLSEIGELRGEITALKASHAECEARCEALTQADRQRQQTFESLMRQLKDPAATAPGGSLQGAIIELAHGDARDVAPPRRRKKS